MEQTTKQAKALIKELKGLMGRFDEKSVARQDEISYWFRDHHTPETEKVFTDFVDEGLNNILVEVDDLRRQFKDEDYRLLPIGVIAEDYFGKSRSWLSQRINGTKVRGKVYTLNAEQKAIFNRAVKEIGNRIGSFQIA